MDINLNTLTAWLALYTAARAIGENVVQGVRNLALGELSTTELMDLESAWADDVTRSAANAGIPAN